MGLSCIITDNAAQFTKPISLGNKPFRTLNHKIDLGKNGVTDIHKVKVSDLPKWVAKYNPPLILPPGVDEITDQILSIYQSYDDLFIILVSKELHPSYSVVEKIVGKLHGRATIHLIDSQTIGVGEGHLVQLAADLISRNFSGSLIEEHLRESIPHIYTLLCTPNLSYLHKAGFIDSGQSTVGEMMSLLPIFTLEDGKLNPLDKVKNIRNVIDYFIEFIDEFDNLQNISFIQPAPPAFTESRMIRQHVEENYPQAYYSEHTINPFLASLIGPRGMGIVITEKIEI